ncbi:DoxX family membrane protein [Anaerolineales bacterium]
MLKGMREGPTYVVSTPNFISNLFSDIRFSWLWLIVRVLIGWTWFQSGTGKLGNPAWMDGGAALKGFWTAAVQVPEEGKAQITYGWYRDFLQSLLGAEAYTWFGPLIAIGETVMGIALIVGAFVGIFAFISAFANMNFMLAGVTSTNPLMFLGGILLILAWQIAGYIGLDYWLLAKLRTPWDWQKEKELREARK